MKYIDLRSDTVTQPTEEMRQTMKDVVVDDDVYRDDPTVNMLEKMGAKMLGKEAAIFVPSGTMGNQIAIMCHTKMGDEIIVSLNSHLVKSEVGGAARLSGVNYSIVDNMDNKIYKEDILERIRVENVHYPDTGLLCLQNPLADGSVMSLDEIKELYNTANDNNIPVHLDGARIFNTSTYLKIDAKEIGQYADSIMFCISKGLCSPVGSLLCGTKVFIDRARKMRKLLGGGMRQAGVLASCGLISLEKMVYRLQEDHDNAIYLGSKLNEIDGFYVRMDKVQINMVFCEITKEGLNYEKFVEKLLEKKIKINQVQVNKIRFVTNNDIKKEDIDYAVECISQVLIYV